MKKFNLSMVTIAMLTAGTFAVAGGDIAPVVAPVEVAPVEMWSGPYIGLQVGYLWGDADTFAYWSDNPQGEVFSLKGFDVNGFMGGAFAGYNWELDDDFLVGIEGEYNFVSADDTVMVGDEREGFGAKVKQEWDASLRVRAGKVMGDYLPYITGGIAWTGMKVDGWTTWGYEDHYDDTLAGWTIGAGVEKKIDENLHARIQYRYTDYGDDTWELDPGNDPDTGKIEYSAHMLTVGVSYRF